MNLTLFLPGAVVLLKAVLKVTVDRQLSAIAVVKGIIFFPIDIIFLSFSYFVAAGLIPSFATGEMQKYPIFVTVVFIVVSMLIAVMCSKSDRFYDAERAVASAALSFVTYFISVTVMLASVGLSH